MEFTSKDSLLKRIKVNGWSILIDGQLILVPPDSEPCHLGDVTRPAIKPMALITRSFIVDEFFQNPSLLTTELVIKIHELNGTNFRAY